MGLHRACCACCGRRPDVRPAPDGARAVSGFLLSNHKPAVCHDGIHHCPRGAFGGTATLFRSHQTATGGPIGNDSPPRCSPGVSRGPRHLGLTTPYGSNILPTHAVSQESTGPTPALVQRARHGRFPYHVLEGRTAGESSCSNTSDPSPVTRYRFRVTHHRLPMTRHGHTSPVTGHGSRLTSRR